MCFERQRKNKGKKEIEKLTRESNIFCAENIVGVYLCILSITTRQMFVQLLCIWALFESDKCEMQPRDKQQIRQGKNICTETDVERKVSFLQRQRDFSKAMDRTQC